MTKLIGTNPNQVPSNADLGTAAFMDKKEFLLSKGSSLSEINAIISNTAVDVFIYDTRKDSDSGAWRKRTQHTSWYNERLNTTTRGKRKEFPAVAVLVLEAGGSTEGTSVDFTIYDGDDPDMPMWMQYRFVIGSGSNTGISARNGIITFCATDNGVLISDFIKDRMRLHNHVHRHTYGVIAPGRLGRSTVADVLEASATGYSIVNQNCKDVAMTVLPNAPIDSATGLPVPTIAVATAGGVSVIKDNGSVVDIVSDTIQHEMPREVKFVENKVLWVAGNNYDNAWSSVNSTPIPASDITVPYYSVTTANALVSKYTPKEWNVSNHEGDLLIPINMQSPRTNALIEVAKDNEIIIGGEGSDDQGTVVKIIENLSYPESGMITQIASDFATGYQVGDIKLATLSDTDDTYVSGPSVLTNYNLSSGNLTGWTLTSADANGAGYANQNPIYVATNKVGIGNTGSVRQDITVETGKKYIVGYKCDTRSGGNYRLGIYFSHVGGSITFDDLVANGETKLYYWTSDYTGTTTLQFRGRGGGQGDFTNFIFDEVEEDRSVNDKGLQVFGTVNKTVVATGADLVAYSGFSTTGAKTNYLHQPYNSDLDFDTSFCFMGWVKVNAAVGTQDQHFFDLSPTTGSGRVNIFWNHGSSAFQFVPGNGASYVTAQALGYGEWHHVVCLANTSSTQIYIDGTLSDTGSGGFNHSLASDAYVTIGTRFAPYSNSAYGLNGSLALIRLSKSSPSPEQIKKIYNDEKFLFQENAKATLYGSSDAVTALAYDDDTELLHVGTSAGRSVFQGLRRIDNTTDAVGAAISASYGMVAED